MSLSFWRKWSGGGGFAAWELARVDASHFTRLQPSAFLEAFLDPEHVGKSHRAEVDGASGCEPQTNVSMISYCCCCSQDMLEAGLVV